MIKIAVITGCYGFIGYNLTSHLLEQGWFVYGVDKLTYVTKYNFTSKYLNKFENFKFINKDINDLKGLPDCDWVINTAAESHVGNSFDNDRQFYRSNVEGVLHLLNLIKNKPQNITPRPKLLHFSTDEVYGHIEKGSFTETSLLNPRNPYAASKAAADMLINSYCISHGLEVITVRPTNNYGWNQYPEKLIPLSILLALRGRQINLHNGGEPYRSWLHVQDTCSAVETLMKHGEIGIYNISPDAQDIIQNKEVVSMILDNLKSSPNCLKIEPDIINLSYNRECQDYRYSIDNTKLKKIGWKPQYHIKNCINDVVWFYEDQFLKMFTSYPEPETYNRAVSDVAFSGF